MEFPSVKSDQETVFTVVIGYKRSNGVAGMPALFKDIPYTLSSFPDVFDSRKPHLYTPHNLGTLLESLHPRPWALIVGPAIRPSLVPEIKAVWDAYVEGVLMRDEIYDDEWRKSAFVPLKEFVYVDPLSIDSVPVDNGWLAERSKQLDTVFRPENDQGK